MVTWVGSDLLVVPRNEEERFRGGENFRQVNKYTGRKVVRGKRQKAKGRMRSNCGTGEDKGFGLAGTSHKGRRNRRDIVTVY